jgi:hypothetical protein
VTALMAAVIEGFQPTRREMLSLTVLSAGVMIAIYEGSQARGTSLGLAACVAGKRPLRPTPRCPATAPCAACGPCRTSAPASSGSARSLGLWCV